MFKIIQAGTEMPCVSVRSLTILHSQSQDLAVFNKAIMILAYILYCIFYWIPRRVKSTLCYEWRTPQLFYPATAATGGSEEQQPEYNPPICDRETRE